MGEHYEHLSLEERCRIAQLRADGIENAIGRMRGPLPCKTILASLDAETLNTAVAAYNNTPRKCLGFQSPAEAFLSQLLHFKCDSISRLSPG